MQTANLLKGSCFVNKVVLFVLLAELVTGCSAQAFKAAMESSNPQSLQAYLEKYSESNSEADIERVAKVKNSLWIMRLDKARQKDTLESYEAYLESYPQPSKYYADQARESHDAKLLQDAETSIGVAGYVRYRSECLLCSHKTEALVDECTWRALAISAEEQIDNLKEFIKLCGLVSEVPVISASMMAAALLTGLIEYEPGHLIEQHWLSDLSDNIKASTEVWIALQETAYLMRTAGPREQLELFLAERGKVAGHSKVKAALGLLTAQDEFLMALEMLFHPEWMAPLDLATPPMRSSCKKGFVKACKLVESIGFGGEPSKEDFVNLCSEEGPLPSCIAGVWVAMDGTLMKDETASIGLDNYERMRLLLLESYLNALVKKDVQRALVEKEWFHAWNGKGNLSQGVERLRPYCSAGSDAACRYIGVLEDARGHAEEAGRVLQEGCDSGDTAACGALGALLLDSSIETERQKGRDLQKQACTKGHGRSCLHLAVPPSTLGKHRYTNVSLRTMESLCERKLMSACNELAVVQGNRSSAFLDDKIFPLPFACGVGDFRWCWGEVLASVEGDNKHLGYVPGLELARNLCTRGVRRACDWLEVRSLSWTVDPFLATTSEGGLVVWNGKKLFPLGSGKDVVLLGVTSTRAVIKKDGGLHSVDLLTGEWLTLAKKAKLESCYNPGSEGILGGDYLFYITGNALKQVNVFTGKSKTLIAKLFSRRRPDCYSLYYDADKGTISVAVGLIEWLGQPGMVDNTNEKDFQVSVKSSPPRPKPFPRPTSTCQWEYATIKGRPTYSLIRRSNKIILTARTGKRIRYLKTVGDLDSYNQCMAETNYTSDDHCDEETNPRLEYSQMKDAPYALCDLRWWDGGADYNIDSVWIDEDDWRVTSAGGGYNVGGLDDLSPSGCWLFIDGRPKGPVSPPGELRDLRLIGWL